MYIWVTLPVIYSSEPRSPHVSVSFAVQQTTQKLIDFKTFTISGKILWVVWAIFLVWASLADICWASS